MKNLCMGFKTVCPKEAAFNSIFPCKLADVPGVPSTKNAVPGASWLGSPFSFTLTKMCIPGPSGLAFLGLVLLICEVGAGIKSVIDGSKALRFVLRQRHCWRFQL